MYEDVLSIAFKLDEVQPRCNLCPELACQVDVPTSYRKLGAFFGQFLGCNRTCCYESINGQWNTDKTNPVKLTLCPEIACQVHVVMACSKLNTFHNK